MNPLPVAQWDKRLQNVVDDMGGQPLNIHALMANHPRLLAAWWDLLKVDPEFLPSWRESQFPGGMAHACELETSLYLYLDEENVRKDKIKNRF